MPPLSRVVRATVTPLASILGSGLLIIVPVLERTLGSLSVFGVAGVCAAAWVVGTSVRHCVRVVEPALASGSPDQVNAWLDRNGDAVIVVAYVISVALYLRIMAQYVVGYADPGGSTLWQRVLACAAVVLIVVVGITRGFAGLNLLDRVSLGAVLALTTLLRRDASVPRRSRPVRRRTGAAAGSGRRDRDDPAGAGWDPDHGAGVRDGAVSRRPVRRRDSRLGLPARATGRGVDLPGLRRGRHPGGAGNRRSTRRHTIGHHRPGAPWLALPLVLSAVLSQFSAAVADTVAAEGNLRGLSRFMRGPTPYLVSGGAAILLAATTPTFTIVAVASRAFAAYYAIQAVLAMRTSTGRTRKVGYGALAVVLAAVTLFAQSAG